MRNIIHVQPALPKYRIDFFERLGRHFGSAIRVYYSPGSLGALTQHVAADWAIAVGPMHWLPGGICWQPDVARISLRRDDVVVLSGNPRQISTLILLIRSKINGARVIWWGHHWSSTSKRWRQILRYLPMALADALLFYTDEEVAAYESDFVKFKKHKFIGSLNNGVNIAPIQKMRRPYRAFDRDRALLFIGRLTSKSQLKLGFDALALLASAAPKLHIIGDGVESDDLRRYAEKIGIAKKIIWHGALTEEKRIAQVANQCQAFLYPGEVGVSLIHGMAYGLPAIVHEERLGHMPEIAAFKEGITGVKFTRGDAASLSNAINVLLSDENQLNRLAAGTVSVVGPSFSTADMARRFINLVDRMEAE